MGNRILLILLLVAAGIVAVVLSSSEEEPPALVDEEYRFRIVKPGPGWSLLPEQSVRNIVPDAIAGVFGPGGAYGVVIAEMAPGDDIELFARTVLDDMSVEDKKEVSFKRIRFKGRDAVRFRITGKVSDIPLVYENTLYINGGFTFQVLGFSPRRGAARVSFEPFQRAFSILDGKVVGRSVEVETRDVAGIGWRLKNGTYESAFSRIAVAPRGKWRVVVGTELFGMNPDADVGLVHSMPELYMTLIIERAAAVDQAAFASSVTNSLGDIEAEHLGKEQQPLSGRTIELQRFRSTSGLPLTLLKGAHFEGDICYQVLAWHVGDSQARFAALLSEAFASIRLLDAAEAGSLRDKLGTATDPENRVGPDFAQRRGRYKDYGVGLELQKPKEGYWLFRAGDEARAENEDARLWYEEPGVGIEGVLVAEPSADWTLDSYHRAATGYVFGDENPGPDEEPEKTTVGGQDALGTQGTYTTENGIELAHRVVSLVRAPWAYQFSFFGVPGNMREAGPTIRAFLDRVSFPVGLAAQREVKRKFINDRMGYSYEPPAGRWKRTDTTPEAVSAVASFSSWRMGRRQVLVCAVCALQPSQDEAWFQSFMEGVVHKLVSGRLKRLPERAESTLGGQRCTKLTWRSGRGEHVVYVSARDRTFYAMVIENPTGPAKAGDAKSGFRFLE